MAPAFGKDYERAQSVVDAWNKGTDFRMLNGEVRGTYCSSRNSLALKAEGFSHVLVHYARLGKVVSIRL